MDQPDPAPYRDRLPPAARFPEESNNETAIGPTSAGPARGGVALPPGGHRPERAPASALPEAPQLGGCRILCTVPSFECQVCGARFDVPRTALDRYPGWRPKYCRDHSPKKKAPSPDRPTSEPAARKAPRGGARRARLLREENLTPAEARAKYSDGPASGVFTDGSASPNPGPGGWGVVWVEDGRIVSEKHGHDPDTTNNRMELRALIEAFTMLPGDATISVYTDSRLCVNTITQWAPGWERRGWKKKSGPIMNLELVKELLALYRAHPACELRWIAAHAGHRWNEYADSLATAWMRSER